MSSRHKGLDSGGARRDGRPARRWTVALLLLAAACSDPPAAPKWDDAGGQNPADPAALADKQAQAAVAKLGSKYACLSPTQDLDCAAKAELRTADGKLLGPGAVHEIAAASVAVGDVIPVEIHVRNTASVVTAAGLRVVDVTLAEHVPADAIGGTFACVAPGDLACSSLAQQVVVPGGLEDDSKGRASVLKFDLRYTRLDTTERTVDVKVWLHGDLTFASKPLTFKVRVRQGQPKLAAPAEVVFAYKAPGQENVEPLQVTNVGDAPLTLDALSGQGDTEFSVQVGETWHPVGPEVALEPPLTLQAGASVTLPVRFAPTAPQKRAATLRLHSNDPAAPDGVPVTLLGNTAVPCLKAHPGKLDFGLVELGKQSDLQVELSNCGTLPVDLTEAKIATGSGEFTLAEVNPVLPGSLPVNGKATASVTFHPSTAAKDPTTGKPAPHLGSLVISGSAPAVTVPLQGYGDKSTCPVAQIKVKQGEQVVPQTTIDLDGKGSYAKGGGQIAKYHWTVKQPVGSTGTLKPNDAAAEVHFVANAAGEYEFCLEVTDGKGEASCVPACQPVLVVPEDCVHVELLWQTPADPDESDTGPAAGSDLDLHFGHPLASGPDIDCDGKGDPWFVNPFDTFWFNPNPKWGSFDPNYDDDPSLDLDDTDGAGPENLNLGCDAEPGAYAVGVHYWNDHGYGTANATVRIYIMSALAVEIAGVPLQPLDMWFVGKINLPNTAMGGSKPPVELCKQSGDACLGLKVPGNPKGGKMWQPAGEHCITHCYQPVNMPTQGNSPATCP